MRRTLILVCVLFFGFQLNAYGEDSKNPWVVTLEEQMGTKEQVSNNGPSHFAIIKDPYKTVFFWNDLGIGPWGLGKVGVPTPLRALLHGEPVDLVIRVANARVGSLAIGLDYVTTSPGTYDDFIAKRGPRGRAFHLAFPVDDLKKAEAQMEALGYSPILIGHDGDGGASFFETTENMGTVIEFVQIPKRFRQPPPEKPSGEMPPRGPMFPPGGDVGILEPLNLAIAVRDVEKAAAHFQVELGVGPWNILTLGPGKAVYNGEEVSVSVKVAVCNTGHLTLVLEQPLSSPSPIQDWLDQNGQGIHHVTFSVKDIESSAAKMKALGYDEFFKVPGMLSYFDTEDALGILVELSEPHTEAPEVTSEDSIVPVEVASTPTFSEAPVIDAEGNIYVSEPGRGPITRITPEGETSVWAELKGSNGHKILSDGTHLVCDHSRKAVLRLDSNGKEIGEAASTCGNKPLRAPNDLVLDSHGGFYFTDPVAEGDDPSRVGYVDSTGQSHLVVEWQGPGFPNGIAVRPDGKILYVSDSMRNAILAFPIMSPGKVGPERVFGRLPDTEEGKHGGPDGITVDDKGNLYIAYFGSGHILVLNSQGELIRRLPAGQEPSNVTFGGPDRDQLYVTGTPGETNPVGMLYRLDLKHID